MAGTRLSKVKFHCLALIAIMLAGIFLASVESSMNTSITIPSSGTIASPSLSPLHVQGQYILDDQNNAVILRGVDCGDMSDAPGGMWQGTDLNTYADWQNNQALVTGELDEIQSWGCNCIRTIYCAEYLVFNESGFTTIIQQYASLCAQRGIYLILAGWCVQNSTVGASPDPLPYPPYQTSTDASAVIPSITAYENMMLRLAQTVQNCPNVIIEMWNEPGIGYTGNATVEAQWFSVCQTTINMIRTAGINNLILVQWDSGIWCNLASPPPAAPTEPVSGSAGVLDWIEDYPLNGSNIVYSTHYYDGTQYPSGVSGGIGSGGLTYAQTLTGFQDCWVNYVLNTLNKPLIFGEVGADVWLTGSDLTQELSDFNYTMTALNSLGVSYCAWEFRISMEYSLINSYAPSWTPTGGGTVFLENV